MLRIILSLLPGFWQRSDADAPSVPANQEPTASAATARDPTPDIISTEPASPPLILANIKQAAELPDKKGASDSNDRNVRRGSPQPSEHERIRELEKQLHKLRKENAFLWKQIASLKAKPTTADVQTATTEFSDAAYALHQDLPYKTNPANWNGRTRIFSYAAPFRVAFANLSMEYKKQTRTHLKMFAEEGERSIKNIEKIQKNRGWITDIPPDIKEYLYGRISGFLRFAYNLVGNDQLTIHAVGKKSKSNRR